MSSDETRSGSELARIGWAALEQLDHLWIVRQMRFDYADGRELRNLLRLEQAARKERNEALITGGNLNAASEKKYYANIHKRIDEIGYDDVVRNSEDPEYEKIKNTRQLERDDISTRLKKTLDAIDRPVASARCALYDRRSQFHRYEARLLGLPISEDDDVSSDAFVHSLRSAIRKERRDRREYYQIRIAFILSLLLGAITISSWIRPQSPAAPAAPGSPPAGKPAALSITSALTGATEVPQHDNRTKGGKS